jgi:gliding motility-associated-like protein
MTIIASQKSLFAWLFVLFMLPLQAQNNVTCNNARPLTNKSPLLIPSVSDYNLPDNGLIGCFFDTLHQTYWLKFTAVTAGTFTFAATSINQQADYDFVLFSEACPCDTASQVVACNWLGGVITPPFLPTGITDDIGEFGITNPLAKIEFEPTVSLVAGKNYYLILDNISNNGVGFNIEFGGTAIIAAPTPDPMPQLGNLLGKKELCEGSSSIYEVETDPRFSTYQWTAPVGAKIIGAGKKVKIDFGNQGGIVKVIAQNSCGDTDTAFLDIKINSTPDLALKKTAFFCQNTCLDLKDILFEEKNNLQNIDFQYYIKKDDAFNGSLKNLAAPTICKAQKIWLRATTAQSCFDTLEVAIKEVPNPSVVLFGGGVVCYGDTVDLSFSFTGKPPYTVVYSDSKTDWTFTTNKDIFFQKNTVTEPSTIYIKSFTETSNICKTRIIGDAVFFPSPNCKCLKKAGSMSLSPIDVCANQKAVAKHNGDEVKGADDKLIFILHNVQTPDLATIFATNDVPEFSFKSGMQYDTPYYIAAVVGKKLANGNVDYADKCLGISLGTPVIFHKPPSATLQGDTLTCNNGIVDITLTPSGMPPFEVSYGNSTLDNVFNINQKTIFKEGTGIFYVKKIKDAMGCEAYQTDTIAIKATKNLTIATKKFICSANNATYQVELEIKNGIDGTYQVLSQNGSVQKNIFTSKNINNGEVFTIKIIDKNACDTLVLTEKHTCACGAVSTPATLNAIPITVCESLAATASFTADENLVAGDIQSYILHDGTATTIGNVFSRNNLPQFQKTNGMATNKTYTITSVAGGKDGTGKIDLNSPCTQIGKSTTITFVEEPTVALAGDTAICEGESANISLSFTGIPTFDIIYNDGKNDVAILNINTLQHDIMLPFTSSTTLIMKEVKTTGAPGCVGKAVIEKNNLSVKVLPSIQANNILVKCSADKKTFTVGFDISGGNGNYTVNNSPINGNIFSSTTISDGQSYAFKIKTANACKPFTVSGTGYCNCPINAAITLKAIDPIKCFDDNNGIVEAVIQNIPAPYQLLWSNKQTTARIENLAAGTYIVTVTNDFNCKLIDSIVLKRPLPMSSEIMLTPVKCYEGSDGSIAFEKNSGGTPPYQFSIDKTFFTDKNIFNNLKSKNYSLVVKDTNGCLFETEKYLSQGEKLQISLGEDQIVPLGETTQLQAFTTGDYETLQWSEPSWQGEQQTVKPLRSKAYSVSIKNKKGCAAEDEVWLYVKAEQKVFAPTSFTPNQDGKNDGFTIYGGIDMAKILLLQIFDRWGNQIYEAQNIDPNDESMGWQGTFRGQLSNQETYIYRADILFIDDKVKSVSGEVTLLH